MCVGRKEAGLGPGQSALTVGKTFLVIFSYLQKLEIIGLSDIVFGGVAKKSKFEVVEGGLTYTNMRGYIQFLTNI